MLRRLSPIQTVLLGFLLLSSLGALLLMTPLATRDGDWQSFADALFMATSAVSTTGLGVVSTSSYYSEVGQIILLILVQVGGLGYMTLIAFIIYLFGRNLSMHGGALMQETIAAPSRGEIKQFVKRVILFTGVFEGVGAAALTLFWLREYSWETAVYYGLFHSVSAFCTAGFSLFDNGFVAYQDDLAFNVIINLISISGAIGFFVLGDAQVALRQMWRRQAHRLTVHSRLALSVLALMSGLATAVFLIVETFPPNKAIDVNLMTASFQTITAVSTTGFNTVDISKLTDTSLLVLAILMFVGSPAGGTGGGIKSTTFGVLILWLWAFLRSQEDVNVFGRRLPAQTLGQSVGITITAALWLFLATLILTWSEQTDFLSVLFEATSALGTVGLSMGLTPHLSLAGKLIITASMMVGRVGPLAVAISLFGSSQKIMYRYPTEEIFVG